MKFSFNNRTIKNAHKSFKSLLGCEYELNNGEIVTIVSVSKLKEFELEFTDLSRPGQLCDGTLIFASFGKLFYGFEVTVRKIKTNGYEESGRS